MMKKYIILLLLYPIFLSANDKETPSMIKEVTVYLNGAHIRREVQCHLKAGTNEITVNDLSHKIDESSIQLSGLQSVSILSMSYDLNYLKESENTPEVNQWETEIKNLELQINILGNSIAGLEEEEKVITANRSVGAVNQGLDLERVKQIGQYYRERISSIKNEIYKAKLAISEHATRINSLNKQLKEINSKPETKEGMLKIKFDAPVAMKITLSLSYIVNDAGWIPNYNIKSEKINAPIELTYKAHIYQKTGQNWDNVKVTLSTGNPYRNVEKPTLEAHFLNFTQNHSNRYKNTTRRKQKYHYNPTVKRVSGKVVDQSGLPLPGVNVVVIGTTTGTQTDFDGNFSLNVAQGRELVFSYLGQETVQLPIYASLMNIRMEEDSEVLQEVVVVGYGTSSIKGKISGVTSAQKTISPLYIIDGVPVATYTEGDLDVNEIQSIEVLQEQEATSVYGNRAANGVVLITTRKSITEDDAIQTKFLIKKPYSIQSDGDIVAIEVNTLTLEASYNYFAAPIIDENVFLMASFSDWEQYNLLPGEANIYFSGAYAGKTTIDPYRLTKKMTISLGIEDNITVTRKQDRNFKGRTFIGNQRVLNRTYTLMVKNNKSTPIDLKLMDRIPLSQHKDIKVSNIETYTADYNKKKGLLSWNMKINGKNQSEAQFSFQIKYPKYKKINL